MAHRVAYELVVGPIPEGLEIDHLCRTRSCVRPDHLDPVTHAENCRRAGVPGHATKAWQAKMRARKTCGRGHDVAEATVLKDGRRDCRACRRERRKNASNTR